MHGSLFQIGPRGEVRQFLLDQERVLIGRGYDCDILLQDEEVSRQHALLLCGEICRILDLGTVNGTWVNGVRIGREPVTLAEGDTIRLGTIALRYAGVGTEVIGDVEPAHQAPSPRGVETRLVVPRDPKTVPMNAPAAATVAAAVTAGTLSDLLLSAPATLLTAEAAREAVVSVVLGADAGPQILTTEHGTTRRLNLGVGDRWTIGRDPSCTISLQTDKASREHATLERVDGGIRVRDLGSRNGTLLNGAAVREVFLRDGDTIRIGTAMMVYRAGVPVRPGEEDAAALPGSEASIPGRSLPRRPVVLVPGYCGTELYLGRTKVWPNYLRLLRCPENKLREYWGELAVGDVVREVVVVPGLVKMEAFGRLIEFLCAEMGYTNGKDLLEFGYDWRQDNRANARLLRKRIQSWRKDLPDPHAKVIIIAHSMGGLLARYFLEHLGGSDSCERLILLGTPNLGSLRAFQLLVAGKGAGAMAVAAAKIQALVSRFPATYQLLPEYEAIRQEDGRHFDAFGSDGWLGRKERQHLAAAATFRQALRDSLAAVVPTTCVFGYGQKTLRELVVRSERTGALSVLREIFAGAGDDAVLEESAILMRAEIHPVRQKHGALYADLDVQRRLRYELTERTSRR